MKAQGYMAIDQYGDTVHLGITKAPRKALMDKPGAKHAEKIYADGKDGACFHVGYIIQRRWFELYQVIPFMRSL